MIRSVLIACVTLACLARAGLGQQPDAALRQLFDDYHEQFLILFPLEATAFGDSRYNDLLPIQGSPLKKPSSTSSSWNDYGRRTAPKRVRRSV